MLAAAAVSTTAGAASGMMRSSRARPRLIIPPSFFPPTSAIPHRRPANGTKHDDTPHQRLPAHVTKAACFKQPRGAAAQQRSSSAAAQQRSNAAAAQQRRSSSSATYYNAKWKLLHLDSQRTESHPCPGTPLVCTPCQTSPYRAADRSTALASTTSTCGRSHRRELDS